MRKYLWPLIVVLMTFVGVGFAEYVRIANERGRLLGQLNEAAVVISTNPPESAEARAAMQRGTMIAVGWPCHWWEDRQTVRSKATEAFENLIALKRQSNAQADPTRLPNQAAENQ